MAQIPDVRSFPQRRQIDLGGVPNPTRVSGSVTAGAQIAARGQEQQAQSLQNAGASLQGAADTIFAAQERERRRDEAFKRGSAQLRMKEELASDWNNFLLTKDISDKGVLNEWNEIATKKANELMAQYGGSPGHNNDLAIDIGGIRSSYVQAAAAKYIEANQSKLGDLLNVQLEDLRAKVRADPMNMNAALVAADAQVNSVADGLTSETERTIRAQHRSILQADVISEYLDRNDVETAADLFRQPGVRSNLLPADQERIGARIGEALGATREAQNKINQATMVSKALNPGGSDADILRDTRQLLGLQERTPDVYYTTVNGTVVGIDKRTNRVVMNLAVGNTAADLQFNVVNGTLVASDKKTGQVVQKTPIGKTENETLQFNVVDGELIASDKTTGEVVSRTLPQGQTKDLYFTTIDGVLYGVDKKTGNVVSEMKAPKTSLKMTMDGAQLSDWLKSHGQDIDVTAFGSKSVFVVDADSGDWEVKLNNTTEREVELTKAFLMAGGMEEQTAEAVARGLKTITFDQSQGKMYVTDVTKLGGNTDEAVTGVTPRPSPEQTSMAEEAKTITEGGGGLTVAEAVETRDVTGIGGALTRFGLRVIGQFIPFGEESQKTEQYATIIENTKNSVARAFQQSPKFAQGEWEQILQEIDLTPRMFKSRDSFIAKLDGAAKSLVQRRAGELKLASNPNISTSSRDDHTERAAVIEHALDILGYDKFGDPKSADNGAGVNDALDDLFTKKAEELGKNVGDLTLDEMSAAMEGANK